jgi:hypothetical protein
MWPFRRAARKSARTKFVDYDSVPKPPVVDGLVGLSEYLRDRTGRMHALIAARRTASPAELPSIDEKMDLICREVAADLDNSRIGTSSIPQLNERLRRMVRLTLEEMLEIRDKARQERRGDG